MKSSQSYSYNQVQGLSTYISPFTKLFCVYISNNPKTDYFYDEVDTISSDQVDALVNDPSKQGFVSTMFGSDAPPSLQKYYTEGDIISSKQMNVNSTLISQYMEGFPLPRPDLNGICDNFQSPSFMQNEETSCSQSFYLQNQC